MRLRFWPKKKRNQALLVAFIALIIIIPIALGVMSYVNESQPSKTAPHSHLVC